MTMSESRDRVLDALKRAGGSTVSGEAISSTLGISRVAVSKHVAWLRKAGYDIESSRGTGYRLLSAPDLLTPAEIRSRLTTGTWLEIEGGVPTASTNDDAKRRARQGARHGTVVVAPIQTGGRGRLGRVWASPSGGAYMSLVLRPHVAPLEASVLPLVIAVGVAEGLHEAGVVVDLKWPNDVWSGGRKLAGILLETATEGETVEWVVAGIGINVVRSDGSPPEAAFVDDVLPGASVLQIAAAVLGGVTRVYERWETQGFLGIRDQFVGRSMLEGEHVTVRTAAGDEVASGTVDGVDELGRLVLVDQSGERRLVSSGDVTLRDPRASD